MHATLNAAGVVRNLAHTALYGPEEYQGLAVKNPYFLQEIIHIIALMTESVCKSYTGKLLRTSAEAFRIEIGIPFSLTSTPYEGKNFCILVSPLLVQISVAIYIECSVVYRLDIYE